MRIQVQFEGVATDWLRDNKDRLAGVLAGAGGWGPGELVALRVESLVCHRAGAPAEVVDTFVTFVHEWRFNNVHVLRPAGELDRETLDLMGIASDRAN